MASRRMLRQIARCSENDGTRLVSCRRAGIAARRNTFGENTHAHVLLRSRRAAACVSVAQRATTARSRRRCSRCRRYTTVGGKTHQERAGRLRDVRQAQRRRRQRDLRPAFLHRHVARGRQVQARPTPRPATGTRSSAPAAPSTPTSISSSARTRSPTSTRRTRRSSTTGPASDRSGHGQAVWHVVSRSCSLRDIGARAQGALDSLGVKKLQAVAGASGGSIQAMEWARALSRLRRAGRPRGRPRLRHLAVT